MNDPISTRLRGLNNAAFVAVMLLASFVIVLPLAWLQTGFPVLARGIGPASLADSGIAVRIMVGVVIAPLVETSLFQWAPLRLARGWLRLPWAAAIFGSALLFAAGHFYSLGYALFALPVGLVLAYAYALRCNPLRQPFAITCAIHAMRNAVAALVL